MKNKLTALAVTAYCIGAILTYGFVFNREYEFQKKRFPVCDLSNRNEALAAGGICAMFWPIYWPLYVSARMFAK